MGFKSSVLRMDKVSSSEMEDMVSAGFSSLLGFVVIGVVGGPLWLAIVHMMFLFTLVGEPEKDVG